MATTSAVRVPRAYTSALCTTCRQRLLPALTNRRPFKTSSHQRADESLGGLGSSLGRNIRPRPYNDSTTSASPFGGQSIDDILDAPADTLLSDAFAQNLNASAQADQAHRLHVYSTKHNTHITFVQPARTAAQTTSSEISGTSASAADLKKKIDVLISLSTGNIGFRKAGRGSYDAAYQLAAFVLKQIQEKGMLRDVRKLEVVLRGFGSGREAASKALLSSEGRFLRGKITSVIDATRLKQGGPRGKKPRRLG